MYLGIVDVQEQEDWWSRSRYWFSLFLLISCQVYTYMWISMFLICSLIYTLIDQGVHELLAAIADHRHFIETSTDRNIYKLSQLPMFRGYNHNHDSPFRYLIIFVNCISYVFLHLINIPFHLYFETIIIVFHFVNTFFFL